MITPAILGKELPPTQIQLELKELRSISSELENQTEDLWVRLVAVVINPVQEPKTHVPLEKEDILVPLAGDLREIGKRLNGVSLRLHQLKESIQL
jgi:hypothetical protein